MQQKKPAKKALNGKVPTKTAYANWINAVASAQIQNKSSTCKIMFEDHSVLMDEDVAMKLIYTHPNGVFQLASCIHYLELRPRLIIFFQKCIDY